MQWLAGIVLVITQLLGLILVPLGLPGLWIMVGGVLAYGWMTDFRTVTVAMIGIVLALAFLGEIIDNWIGFRFARRYGGSRRAGWGALIRGLIGGLGRTDRRHDRRHGWSTHRHRRQRARRVSRRVRRGGAVRVYRFTSRRGCHARRLGGRSGTRPGRRGKDRARPCPRRRRGFCSVVVS